MTQQRLKVVVEVGDGMVQQVYCDAVFVDVVVVDWDNKNDNGGKPEVWEEAVIALDAMPEGTALGLEEYEASR